MAEFYAEEELDFREARARGALSALLADGSRGAYFFIRESDAVVGYFVLTVCFSLEFGGRFALLDEFYVRSAHRGQGIGERVLAFIEQLASEWRAAAVRLEVDRRNPRVRRLYERAGFAAHERDLMTKWLDGA